MSNTIKIKNKKARYEYELIEKYVAGIQLTGTEIKSIRTSKASITEAYCAFNQKELWVKNMHIAEYSHGNIHNHEPKRERKLLLKKGELKKIAKKINEKGLTLIPTLLFVNEKGLAKLEIAIAKGKKLYDKRQAIKDKETKRQVDRELKNYQ